MYKSYSLLYGHMKHDAGEVSTSENRLIRLYRHLRRYEAIAQPDEVKFC